MQIRAVLAQVPVTRDVEANVRVARQVLADNESADLIVFPEGLVSGYSADLWWLGAADAEAIEAGLGKLVRAARHGRTSLWVGSLVRAETDMWRNVAVGITPEGRVFEYQKANLATCERGLVAAGNALPVFDLPIAGGAVPVGVQICRELRHPEQWRVLAAAGAKLFLHLNNALAEGEPNREVWRSLLISRAVENQRFVLSANAAGRYQRVPTMAIAPDGEVLAACTPDEPSVIDVAIDLAAVSDTYVQQIRRDLLRDSVRQPPRP